MTFYKFKTFKSTYYFPDLSESTRFIYSLYGNYGGTGAHVAWWMFTHSRLFRSACRVKDSDVEGYSKVRELLGPDCVFGINTGTVGPDQKMSILGYERSTGKEFFAKLATKERAMALTRNEIKVHKMLEATDLMPKLFDYSINDNYVFIKCECIKGNHVHGQIDERQVMDMLTALRQRHYSDCPSTPYDLKTCFAHMDFCPWNMIEVEGKLHIIDWEMADEMPLGFDLFTYLIQTNFLIGTETCEEIIKKNEHIINEYFQTARADWQPYLEAFLDWKIKFFSTGHNNMLLQKFEEARTCLT